MLPWQWATLQGLTFFSLCSLGGYLPAALILALFSHHLFAWYQLRAVSVVSRVPVGFDNIYISSARESEWRKAEVFWIPHPSGAALQSARGWFKATLFHPVLEYLIHAVHFLRTRDSLRLRWRTREFHHQFQRDRTPGTFATKGDRCTQRSEALALTANPRHSRRAAGQQCQLRKAQSLNFPPRRRPASGRAATAEVTASGGSSGRGRRIRDQRTLPGP